MVSQHLNDTSTSSPIPHEEMAMRWVCQNRSSLSLNRATEILLYFQSVDNNPLYLGAEIWQVFFLKLKLVFCVFFRDNNFEFASYWGR